MSDPLEMDPKKIVKELMGKYSEYGLTYEDLLKRVVNLEDDLPIPYEEAMNDIITWKKALEALGEESPSEAESSNKEEKKA